MQSEGTCRCCYGHPGPILAQFRAENSLIGSRVREEGGRTWSCSWSFRPGRRGAWQRSSPSLSLSIPLTRPASSSHSPCLTLPLFLGLFLSLFLFRPSLYNSCARGGGRTLSCSWSFRPGRRGAWQRSSPMMAPHAHRSIADEYVLAPSSSSGARYLFFDYFIFSF
jgi:hypothetical protein